MKNFLLITTVLMGFLLPVASAQTWTPVGPEGGSFGGVVVDPTDPDVLTIIGAAPSPADVYHSTDGGNSWSIVGGVGSDFSLRTMAAYDMNTLYAVGYDSTYVYSIASSKDGGVTWTTASITDGTPGAVCTHPTDPNMVYASGYLFDYGTYTYIGKFWASTDGGVTWTSTDLPDGAYDGAMVMGMGLAPTNPDVIYITGYQFDASYNYFALTWKSTDGGATWTDISAQVDPDPNGEMWSIYIDPTDENIIHGGGWIYTHRSTDGGATWTRYPDEMPGCTAGAIDPNNTDTVYLGNGSTFYKSVDQGVTWNPITGGFGGNAGQIAIAPSLTSTVYQANPYGGNFKSLDYGETWNAAHSGIMAASLTAVATAPSNPCIVLGTTLGGQLFGSTDGCQTLEELTYPPECTIGNFSDILISSTNPDIVMGLAVG